VPWGPSEEKKRECSLKRKNPETECFNFIRVLVALNSSQLYACGTNAFSPACTHILLDDSAVPWVAVGQRDGKGQSPFDPRHSHTALLDGGELYAATANNFHGTEPIISRSLGGRTALKTDASLRWLAGGKPPHCWGSPPHSDSTCGSHRPTAGGHRPIATAPVGHSTPLLGVTAPYDVGGDKVLQKKWTTFLKAQLQCAPPGRPPFGRVRHVASAPPAAGGDRSAEFYGVFEAQWLPGGSALCSFSRAALRAAFEGRFLEREKDGAAWSPRSAPSGGARPGSCSVAPWSDQALTFMKEHFLMETPVPPNHGRPLLLSPNVSYTHIAVLPTRGLGGAPFRLLFMATAEGSVHKALELPGGRALILESIALFEQPRRVSSFLLSASKVRAWGGSDPMTTWLQDVEGGDARSRCQRARSGGAETEVAELTLSPALHSVVRLPCPRRSAWAAYSWERPGGGGAAAGGAEQLPDLTLLVVARRGALGAYTCWATENGFRWAAVRYRLREPEGGGWGREEGAATPPPGGSYWPQLVAVAALLALTLPAAAASALVAYRARSKVRGCAAAAGGVEKAPLNGAGGGERGCCLQMDGGSGADRERGSGGVR
ncbi:semaphorin-4A, partial [Phasianus colchicus]|uniref:semaphorin-4A n=1 Tax=Phasianus colchicus TaxID=9054 RepID=UPI00129E6D7B